MSAGQADVEERHLTAVHRLAEHEPAQRREAVPAGRRAVTALLASFAAPGGAPPASYELVRVLRDGTVRALAGTAWPGFGPASEAGVYEFALDGAALAELERLAGDPGLERELDGALRARLGPARARAGRGDRTAALGSVHHATRAGRLRWPSALQALLGEARAHPARGGPARRRGDAAVEIGYTFTALGREPRRADRAGAPRGRGWSRRRSRRPTRRRSRGCARRSASRPRGRQRPARAGRDAGAARRARRAPGGGAPARRRLRARRPRPRAPWRPRRRSRRRCAAGPASGTT